MTRISEIRARLEAATPGPWKVDYDKVFETDTDSCVTGIFSTSERIVETDFGCYQQKANDAEFIAHASADIAWLLEQLERAEQALIWYEENACGNSLYSGQCSFYHARQALRELRGETEGK